MVPCLERQQPVTQLHGVRLVDIFSHDWSRPCNLGSPSSGPVTHTRGRRESGTNRFIISTNRSAYLDYVLTHITGHKINRIDELLPWRVADKLHTPGSPPAPPYLIGSSRSSSCFTRTRMNEWPS
nr:transposase domain-containing protein [Paraburkholderia tropica]